MLGCNVPLSLHAEVLLHYVLLYGTTWSCVPSSHALFNWGMLANPELYPMKAVSKVELGNQGLLGYVSANTVDLVAFAVLIISSWCCPSRFKTIWFWAEARMFGVQRIGLHWDYSIFSNLSFLNLWWILHASSPVKADPGRNTVWMPHTTNKI